MFSKLVKLLCAWCKGLRFFPNPGFGSHGLCVLEAGPHDVEQVKGTSKPSWSTCWVNGRRQEYYLRSQTGPLQSKYWLSFQKLEAYGGGTPGGGKVWVGLSTDF